MFASTFRSVREVSDSPSPSLSYALKNISPNVVIRIDQRSLTNREKASLNSETCSSVSESAYNVDEVRKFSYLSHFHKGSHEMRGRWSEGYGTYHDVMGNGINEK